MLALALLLVAGEVRAQQLPTVPELLAAKTKTTQGCEVTGDLAVVKEQGTLRDRLSGRLAQAGYCWGRKVQTEVKKEWHSCGPDSTLYADDIEAMQR